ncbi:MAG: hypothetical protein LQ350_003862 [Teloschistes chrysophthalmus]|nr:MAG: hypothetical protein LQ350_003862 [Niorma chrysophthalma]
MPSRRVILDSDEEDNANDSPAQSPERAIEHSSNRDSTNANNLSSSPHPNQQAPSAGHSTGSTEVLNREIKEAYNGLLEPSTSRSSRSSHPSSDSPSISKRRPTTEFGERPVKRPKVTYGARKSQDDSTARFDIEDEEPLQKSRQVKLNKDVEEDLADDVAEADDRHNTSSGWLADFGKSGKLNGAASTEGRRGKPDDGSTVSNQSMAPPASRSSGTSQQPLQSSIESTWPNTERASSPPAAGVLTSVVQRTRKRALSEHEPSPKIILGDEVPPSSSAPASSPVKRARTDAGGRGHALTGSPRKSDDGHDELSLSTTSSPTSTRKQSKASKTDIGNTEQADRDFALALKLQEEEDKDVTAQKRRRGDTSKATQPTADDLMPDLPAEQYQPRPSRSRSARTTDDLVVPSDFSKRPETLAKKKEKGKGKVKRGKSTAADEPQQSEPQQQEDQHMLEPDPKSQELEPSANDAQRPHSEDPTTNGPDPTTIEVPQEPTPLPSPNPPNPPHPPQKKPKKPRGRPKKGAPPSPPPPPAAPAPDPEPPRTEEPAANTPLPAPAKRGRKKKQKQKVVSEETVTDEELEDPRPETDVGGGGGGGGGGVLKEIAINVIPTPSLPSTSNRKEKEKEEEKEGIEAPAVKDKVEKVDVVNIKREVRIAPLLRVVKK